MSIGGIGGIDSSRIQAMMEQLKAAATKPAASLAPAAPAGLGGIGDNKPVAKLDFADALHSTLQEVSNKSRQAEELGKRFAMGDDTVSLSDTMIASTMATPPPAATRLPIVVWKKVGAAAGAESGVSISSSAAAAMVVVCGWIRGAQAALWSRRATSKRRNRGSFTSFFALRICPPADILSA